MKLLLIEDETQFSKTLCQKLKKEGYVVDDITDGEIGLEMALFGSSAYIMSPFNPHKSNLSILSNVQLN
ncbi:MAG: hypothetical protein WA125_11730 [Desulfosporosinus sp.]